MDKIEVAINSNTSPETLHLLAQDDNRIVRFWVAINHNTSPETLYLLVQDDGYSIRYHSANNPNATELIRRLYLMRKNEQS